MILPGKIEIGEKITLTISFTDDGDGALVDPSVIQVKIRTPSGVDTTYTYGTDVEVLRSSTGIYYINLSLDEAGRWYYHWLSTGTAQTAKAGSFNVQYSPFYDNLTQDYV